jgi:hypothetical protein
LGNATRLTNRSNPTADLNQGFDLCHALDDRASVHGFYDAACFGGPAPWPFDERTVLPKASFIGFTGTPIESGDKNTQAVFGDLASQARHQLVSQHYNSRFARRGH